MIFKKLTKGSFGQVYEGVDIQDNKKSIICKINGEEEMNDLECKILIALNKTQYKNFPKYLDSGKYKERSFQIIERFGNTLEFYQL